jgi:hypothetical protein
MTCIHGINLVRWFPLGSILIERIEPQRYIRLGLSSGHELADFKNRSTFAGGFDIKHRRFADPWFTQQHKNGNGRSSLTRRIEARCFIRAVDYLDATVDRCDPGH